MAHLASLIGTIEPRAIIADVIEFDNQPDYADYDILHDHDEEMRTLYYRIISAIARLLPERCLLRESADGQSWDVLSPTNITSGEIASYAEITGSGLDVELGRRIGIADMIREAIQDAKNAEQV